MDMPPTRYRVIEQGRRLVVIDGWSGRPVQADRPAAPDLPRDTRAKPVQASTPSTPPPAGYTGTRPFLLKTARWFDDQGPRTISIGQTGQGQLVIGLLFALFGGVILFSLFSWVLVVILGFVLIQPKAWRGLRRGITIGLTALDNGQTATG
jgi:hypothetical protein